MSAFDTSLGIMEKERTTHNEDGKPITDMEKRMSTLESLVDNLGVTVEKLTNEPCHHSESENDKAKRREKMKMKHKSRSPNEDYTFFLTNQFESEMGRN